MNSNPVPPESRTNGSGPESEHELASGEPGTQVSPGVNPSRKSAKRRLRRHKKRVRLSEAMRAQGIDEHTIAEAFAEVVVNLRETAKSEGKEKVLVDVLKECTKALVDRPARGNEPISVHLIHNIPRPLRGGTEPVDDK
jgi:hypothetical protein